MNEDWIINKDSTDATPLASNDASNDEKDMDEELNTIDIEGDETQLAIMEVVEDSNTQLKQDSDKHSNLINDAKQAENENKQNESVEVDPNFIDEQDAIENQAISERELKNDETFPTQTIEASEFSNKSNEKYLINDNNTDYNADENFDFLNSSGESLGLNDDNLTEAQRQFLAANNALINVKRKDSGNTKDTESERNSEESDSESERLVIDT